MALGLPASVCYILHMNMYILYCRMFLLLLLPYNLPSLVFSVSLGPFNETFRAGVVQLMPVEVGLAMCSGIAEVCGVV